MLELVCAISSIKKKKNQHFPPSFDHFDFFFLESWIYVFLFPSGISTANHPPPSISILCIFFSPTSWFHVLFLCIHKSPLLDLLPGSSSVIILLQMYSPSLLCTCPNHLSLAPLKHLTSLCLGVSHLSFVPSLRVLSVGLIFLHFFGSSSPETWQLWPRSSTFFRSISRRSILNVLYRFLVDRMSLAKKQSLLSPVSITKQKRHQ